MSNATPRQATPVSLQPPSANDARAPRPVYWQTSGAAVSHAKRLAMAASPVGLATAVKFVSNAWRATGAAAVFVVESCQPGDDYVVREASAAEIHRAQQAGIRSEVARLYEHAATEDAAADRAKTATFVKMHSKWAADSRNRARELETSLTVSGVYDCAEPIFSAERDSREAGSL
jgi:hypothetical protein